MNLDKAESTLEVAFLKSFLVECLHLLNKRLYKKVYEEIEIKIPYMKDTIYLDFLLLKISAIIKILSKKFYKAEISIRPCEHWLRRLDLNLKQFYDIMKTFDKSTFIIYLESYIQCQCDMFYLLALYNKREGNLADCMSYLSIAYKTLNSYIDNVVQPKTLLIFQKIIIFISNILIADNDFKEAFNFQQKGLTVCYRQLFLTVDFQSGLETNINTLKENLKSDSQINEKIHYFQSLIANLVTLLFHQGICLESLGLITEALFNYSQSRFFTERYLSLTHSEFLEFIKNIEVKLREYKETLSRLEQMIQSQDNKLGISEENYNKQNENKLNVKSYETVKSKIENVIKNLRLEDLNDIELFSKRDNISKNVSDMSRNNKLLSLLLSKDFNETLLNIEETNFTKMKIKDFRLIQKKLAELRNENLIKLSNKEKGKNSSNSKTTKYIKVKPRQYSQIFSDRLKDQILTNLQADRRIVKYNHSNYILSKSYRKKYSHLENVSYKDIQFHKSILQLKGEEFVPCTIMSKSDIFNNAKDFLDTKIRSRKIIVNEQKEKSPTDKRQVKYESTAIKSLNNKKLVNYIKERDVLENQSYYNHLLNKFKTKAIVEFGRSKETSKHLNDKVENILEKEIKEIDKHIENKTKIKRSESTSLSIARQKSTHLYNKLKRSQSQFYKTLSNEGI